MRPVSGNARANVVSTRLSDAEYRAVMAQSGGNRAGWLRQLIRHHLGIAPMGTPPPPITPPTPAQSSPPATRKPTRPARDIRRRPNTPPTPTTEPKPQDNTVPPDETPQSTPTPHRHRRQRTGEHWIGGTDVGTWKCTDCGVTLGPLQ
jgi:hypothetical protein